MSMKDTRISTLEHKVEALERMMRRLECQLARNEIKESTFHQHKKNDWFREQLRQMVDQVIKAQASSEEPATLQDHMDHQRKQNDEVRNRVKRSSALLFHVSTDYQENHDE